MHHPNILRILSVGFGLMVLLLVAAAVIGFRRSNAIQDNASSLVREHLQTSRLVDELEVEQHRMATVLLRLSRFHTVLPADMRSLFQDVDASVREVLRLKDMASSDRETWTRLAVLSQEFATGVRSALEDPDINEEELQRIVEANDNFVHTASQLIKGDAVRALAIEESIGQQSRRLVGESLWLLSACLLLGVICAAFTVRVIHLTFLKVEWQAEEISRVSWHMLQGQEAAARRFAHEMHDELGQALAGLKATIIGTSSEEFPRRRQECVKLLDEAIGNVRELSQLLRPVILDDFGLDSALRWVCERFEERTRIEVKYESNFNGRLADESETHLFRITQEALTNVARHAGAKHVAVQLLQEGEQMRLMIEDDGCGLEASPGARKPSLGMIGMRARAHQAGGELRVGVSKLGGVKIEIQAPVRRAEPDNEETSVTSASLTPPFVR